MGEANRRGSREDRVQQARTAQQNNLPENTQAGLNINGMLSNTRKAISRSIDLLIAKFDDFQLRGMNYAKKNHTTASLVTLTILGIISYVLCGPALSLLLSDQETFKSLSDLMLTLGGALLGVTAIAFSFIMFALQVNIERLPYGQFYKSSTDPKLLISFASTFLISLAVASASLIQDTSYAVSMAFMLLWGSITIFVVLLLSFKRALGLINPVTQLNLISEDVKQNFGWWEKRFQRRKALLTDHLENAPSGTSHDWSRVQFIRLHPQIENTAMTSLNYASGIAKRYWRANDHEIAGLALTSLININACYIKFKGKTFFASNPFIDTGDSTDVFINASLEELKRMMAGAILIGDEQQIIQIFRAYSQLIALYLSIDYSQEHVTFTHANIAAGYLKNDVLDVVKLNNPDLLMRASEELGKSAKYFLGHDATTDSTSLIDTIGSLAIIGSANEKLHPVTYSAMTELKDISLLCIGYKKDSEIVLKQLNEQVKLASEFFIKNVKERTLSRSHSYYLGPYYGFDSLSSFQHQLVALTNTLSHKDKLDDESTALICNIVKWADSIVFRDKELLKLTASQNSSMFHCIVCWLDQVTTCLMALSSIADCPSHEKDRLQTICSRLVYIFSWIPNDDSSVQTAEAYEITETLFELGNKSLNLGSPSIAIDLVEILTSWAFKAAKYGRGCGSFDKAIAGAAILTLNSEDSIAQTKLLRDLEKFTQSTNISEKSSSDFLQQMEGWAEGPGNHYSHSGILMELQRNYSPDLQALLNDIKDTFLAAKK